MIKKEIRGITIENTTIDRITFSRRRTTTIEVDIDGRVTVRFPAKTSERKMLTFIKKNLKWIEKAKQRMKLKKQKLEQTTSELLHSKPTIKFLGYDYPIILSPSNTKPRILLSGFLVSAQQPDIIEWYREKAGIYLPALVRDIAAKQKLEFSGVKITSARKTFGSCNPKKQIRLSWRILIAPKDVVKYVVAHELAHTRHLNHKKRFKKLLEKLCPDYKKHERWLRKNSHLFMLPEKIEERITQRSHI